MVNSKLTEHQTDIDTFINDQRHFKPSVLALFLPIIVVSIGYGLIWFWLYLSGQSHSALARICMFVLVLGVPLISAYNLLRYATLGIKLNETFLKVHSGFPSRDPIEIPYILIKDVKIVKGLAGRWTGAASLQIFMSSGKPITIAALIYPKQAKAAIQARCAI